METNNENLQSALRVFGFKTAEEAIDWLKQAQATVATQEDIFGHLLPANETSNKSNVTFCVGDTTTDTHVCVNGIPINNIVRAKLEYESELGLPVLFLEIVSPRLELDPQAKYKN